MHGVLKCFKKTSKYLAITNIAHTGKAYFVFHHFLALLMMRFVLPFIKVLKISRLFCQDPENVETFSSRPRPRPRPRSRLLFRDQDQDHFSCPRGTLRLHPWWSYMAGHMVISHPPRLKIPRLSVVELCVLTSPILYY